MEQPEFDGPEEFKPLHDALQSHLPEFKSRWKPVKALDDSGNQVNEGDGYRMHYIYRPYAGRQRFTGKMFINDELLDGSEQVDRVAGFIANSIKASMQIYEQKRGPL